MIVPSSTSVCIRSATVADLKPIGELFSPAKQASLLQWLLGDPERGLRSLVAVVDGQVVGHVGYTISTFTDGVRNLTGVYPITWKVREDCTGAVGLRLMTRVFSLADFSYIIGGSAAAQKLYRVFGFKRLFDIPSYRKTVSLRGLGRGLLSRRGGRALRMRSQAAWSAVVGRRRDEVSVILEDDASFEARAAHAPVGLTNAAPVARLRWAAACPVVEAYPLALTIDGQKAGPVLCYVRRPAHGPVTGTIVYMPYLGPDARIWSAALRRIEPLLTSKGCSQITVMASDETFADALQYGGFAMDRSLPLWFRGQGGPPPKWHVTFLEGDLGYRK